MAEPLSQLKDKVKNKIEVIKKVKDDGKASAISYGEDKLKDLPSIQGAQLGKKITDLQSKAKKTLQNKTDIFKDLVDLVEKFLSKKIEPSNKMFSKQRLRQITTESIQETLKSSKKIILDSSQKILFSGDGICGSVKTFTGNTISVSPKEIDFMNVLTIDPTSNVGQIVYEQEGLNPNGLIRMNRELYNLFNTTGTTTFTGSSGNNLFDIEWDESNQVYDISGLSGQTIGDLLSDYYSSIEFLDISGVTKNAVMMTINPDSSSTKLFDLGLNDLNRLLSKILCFCNNNNISNGLNQNAINQFNENDQDDEYFFDFEDLEGIDLDDEARRFQRVMKFKDCGDFEIQSRPEHFEDFVYLSNVNLNESVNDVLENVATSTFEQSGQSLSVDSFQLNLLNNFILNLPKALISSVLSPKYFLPIIVAYKYVVSGATNIIQDAKTLMKSLSKLFKLIIIEHFWKFITEFWNRVKKDLITFLKDVALNIIKKKQRRLLSIVSGLIALITKLLNNNLPDCNSLYSIINKTIDTALAGNGFNLPIPPPLLIAAKLRGGYSSDRATINIIDQIQNSGNPHININPINGQRNPLLDLVKSIVEGHDEEFRNNNTIKAFTIPGTTETMGIVI